MKAISSKIENIKQSYAEAESLLHEFGFILGGNWDYQHGYFDKHLDDKHTVWLRIPFQVISGTLEGDTFATDTAIQLGLAFVLHHQYNEGLDPKAEVHVVGALWDQFQTAVDADADVQEKWVKQASEVLQQVEDKYFQKNIS